MINPQHTLRQFPTPAPPPAPSLPPLGDPRFRALIGAAEWGNLPAPVRRRFSKRLAGGASVVYRGVVTQARMSRLGFMLAQVARLIGGPLPTSQQCGLPAVVTVTEDMETQGQHWSRLYVRQSGFPQVIHSSKRFAGPTGLEEYIGGGIGMTLRITVESGTLVFRSAGYFVQVLGKRLLLPGWLTPGALKVTHAEIGDGRFRFTLSLVHPRFGELIAQSAEFADGET